MTRDDFWQLVAKAIGKKRRNLERAENDLDKLLKSLEAKEIEEFARHYVALQNEANTPSILEAAYIIGFGDSNDGFMDFRRWIVFQGQTEFAKILANPDYLGTYEPQSEPMEQWGSEYDPRGAYEAVTGRELPASDVVVYPEAKADFQDAEILAERYPTLWRRIQATKIAHQDLNDRGKDLFLNATLDHVEDQGGVAILKFSTGAEIRIRDYWGHYRARYRVAHETPCYDDHPMIGQSVVSITSDSFPRSFHLWFANRRKLSLGCEIEDCSDFEVFEGTTRID